MKRKNAGHVNELSLEKAKLGYVRIALIKQETASLRLDQLHLPWVGAFFSRMVLSRKNND